MIGCNKNDKLCCNGLLETEEEFKRKMERGYTDAMEGRGKSLDEVFDNLEKNVVTITKSHPFVNF